MNDSIHMQLKHIIIIINWVGEAYIITSIYIIIPLLVRTKFVRLHVYFIR